MGTLTQYEDDHRPQVFVFGSNEAGRHGKGAALEAYKKYGARYGQGYGFYGRSFAIPTLDGRLRPISIQRIQGYVGGFKSFAASRTDIRFKVTCIGCGLAGRTNEEMAFLFLGSTSNCYFDTVWRPWLGESVNYWGTFP